MAKILVVEDEPEIRRMIVEELTDEGHVTIEACNGREGLEKMTAEVPDLVLSDITMPQMNGYQFFRAFKESHTEHAHTPFIFLTALADRDDELKGLRLGVDDYISKPIDFDLLLARVELGLRRHRTLAKQVAPLAKSPQPSDSGAQTTGTKINEIVASNDGLILTGKFETISLEAIKTKVGERWTEMSHRLLTNARAAIHEHLGPKDVCRVTASEDFVVCFAELTDEQIDTKVRRIGDAIWDRLFGVTDDEDLSQVDAQAYEIHLESDDTRDVDATFTEIEGLIEKQKMAASHANLKALKQIYEYEDLFALTLFSSKGKPSSIKMLSFEEQHAARIRKLFEARRYESKFLLELQQRLFDRLKERPNISRAFRQAVMLLPIHFVMIEDQETRALLIDLCLDLKNSIDGDLVVEIVETPNRIKTHRSILKPLPVGRGLQFLEIRRTAQLDGVNVDDLQALSIAFVSMRYEDLVYHDQQDLSQHIKMLEKGGIKFCIKGIPEGKLLEAQMRKAHLYALKK